MPANRLGPMLIGLISSARFLVHGNSMLPALANRESVLAVRIKFCGNRLRRGDIVVLQHPVWKDRTYIKRIIGLPDEDLRLEEGLVYLKGELLEETYLKGPFTAGRDRDGEWWMGPDEYFVLGDNRCDSEDSRAFGPVGLRLILGRVWFRCWPLRSWGRISELGRAGS